MKTYLFTFVSVAGLAASLAQAQVAEFSVSGGQSRLPNKGISADYSLDDGFALAFRTTLNSTSFFGHEFGYAYNRTKLFERGQQLGGMAIHQGFYNYLAYATPEGKRFRPFVAGGAHFSNFVPPGQSATQGGGSTKYGINYGGGVKVRVSDRYMIRADYRQYLTGKPFGNFFPVSGSLKQNQITVGFAFVL